MIMFAGGNENLRAALESALSGENADLTVWCGKESELPEALEHSRGGHLIFLADTSALDRAKLADEKYEEYETRFVLSEEQALAGITKAGIAEDFQPVRLPDNVILNRCAEIGGTGRVRQWFEAHLHKKEGLRYTSFGGSGKQVFELLHPADLAGLIRCQIRHFQSGLYHVSGGKPASVSLLELTTICECATGHTVRITNDESRTDVPVLSLDTAKAQNTFGWFPRCGVEDIIREMEKQHV